MNCFFSNYPYFISKKTRFFLFDEDIVSLIHGLIKAQTELDFLFI